MVKEDVVDLAVKNVDNHLVLVLTANDQGVPHLAAADAITKTGAGQIAVTQWFCPTTAENAVSGKAVSVVVWDPASDRGHQMIGRVAAIEELAMLDGYQPEANSKPPLPQVERRLRVDVEQVLTFHKAPHSDVEE